MKILITSFNFKYYLPTAAIMAIIVGSIKILRNYNYLNYYWDILLAYLLFIVLFTLTISYFQRTYHSYTLILMAISFILVLSTVKFILIKNKIKTKIFIKYEIPIYICALTTLILTVI